MERFSLKLYICHLLMANKIEEEFKEAFIDETKKVR